jgi:molecular chaperone DnaK (HSP70)
MDEAGKPHPSVVWYSPDGVKVGAAAKEHIHAFSDAPGHRFVRSVKRFLGKGHHYDVAGRRLEAYQVGAAVFRHLKDHAAGVNQAWDVNDAVVTVPVTFDGPARRDIRRAAAAAGIHVRMFVHEPFAAIIGYYHKANIPLDALREERVLVFDWGGGTLDITLVQTGGDRIQELATGGLRDVGGDRFDERLQNWAIDRFAARHGLQPETVAPGRGQGDRLAEESERVKIELSARSSEIMGVARVWEQVGRSLDMAEPVTRRTLRTSSSTTLPIQWVRSQVSFALLGWTQATLTRCS